MPGYAVHIKYRGIGFDFKEEGLKMFVRTLPRNSLLRSIFLPEPKEPLIEENQNVMHTFETR